MANLPKIISFGFSYDAGVFGSKIPMVEMEFAAELSAEQRNELARALKGPIGDTRTYSNKPRFSGSFVTMQVANVWAAFGCLWRVFLLYAS